MLYTAAEGTRKAADSSSLGMSMEHAARARTVIGDLHSRKRTECDRASDGRTGKRSGGLPAEALRRSIAEAWAGAFVCVQSLPTTASDDHRLRTRAVLAPCLPKTKFLFRPVAGPMGWTPARSQGARPSTGPHEQRPPTTTDDRPGRTMGWQPARQVAEDRVKVERPMSAREPRMREKSNDGWNVSRPARTRPRALPAPDAGAAWDDSTKAASSPPKSRGHGGGRWSPRGGPTGWEAARSPEWAGSPPKAASGARFATDDALARAGLARPGSAPPASLEPYPYPYP